MRKFYWQWVMMAMMLLIGCRRSSTSGWTAVCDGSDSVMECLERINFNFGTDDEKRVLTDSLCAIASRSGNRQTLSRAAYWRASQAYQHDDIAEAERYIAEAVMLQDSAMYPYDNMRIRVLGAKIADIPPAERYSLYSDALHYYLSIGDTLMAGTACMDLGNLLSESGNPSRGEDFYRQADLLLMSPKGYGVRLRNRLNLANVAPMAEKIRIYEELRAYPALRRDSIFSELLWRNSFIATDNISYLDTADRYVRAGERGLAAAHLVWRADYWRRHMVEDSVRKYAPAAFDAAIEDATSGIRALSILTNAYSLHISGNTGEALEMFPLYVAVADSLMIEQADRSVAEMDSRMRIDEVDRVREGAHQKSLLIGGIVIMVVICVFSVLLVWLVKSRKIAEMKRRMADVELMRRQEQLILSAMSIESKERVIATLSDNLDSLRDSCKIGEMEALKMKGQLNAVMQPDADLDGLRTLRENLNPEFELRLKEDYPDLTEHDLRLASLISVGLTNKQIAGRLAISHASVNTARYRLRIRLGLQRGDSLEDFLRRYRR